MDWEVTVQINNLTAGYGRRPVLYDIRLQVGEGRIVGLLGPNGSGKTTLMRCINSIIKPLQGEVCVRGYNVNKLDRMRIARLVSLVPQKTSAVFSYSCQDMIVMGMTPRLNVWSKPGKEACAKARQVCEEIGIADLLEHPFNQLSGGQQQLVLLARALVQDTPVMLLDEPTSHLDFSNQHRVLGLMLSMARSRGVTSIITLHDPNLALHYCDEVVILKEGRIIAGGQSRQVMNNSNLCQAFGQNIEVDSTGKGLRVVVPRSIAVS